MILYHGSNLEVREPRIIKSKRLLDFGIGFYLTSDFEQAKKWALRTTRRRDTGVPIVTVFRVDELRFKSLRLLKFDTANGEWLKFVTLNRTYGFCSDYYDVVIGPVADDQAIRTVNNFVNGYFTEDIAIQLLLPQKLKDQYTFKANSALSLLEYMEARYI